LTKLIFINIIIVIGSDLMDAEKTIDQVNEELKNTQAKLEQAYLDTIETLRCTVDAKDSYTKGHSERVSEYAVLIGKHLGISSDEMYTLRIGGLFHDVGKIGISDNILSKKGKLTDDEFDEIKKHPVIGAQILSNASIFSDIISIVKYHHERFDGTGYPEHLKGKEIPYLARIVSVADAFDAMNSRRPYRDTVEIQTIYNEISKNKKTQFDPEVADALLDIIQNNYSAIEEIQQRYEIHEEDA
jgi:putative nucleotidyltransferase with HDIG domain